MAYIIWGSTSMMEVREIKIQETENIHTKTKNSYNNRTTKTYIVNTKKSTPGSEVGNFNIFKMT